MRVRRSYLGVTYNKKNVTESIRKYLIGWTYTDYLSGQINNIQIDLQDSEHLWMSKWMPTKGAWIKAAINMEHWPKHGDKKRRNLGAFEVDTIQIKGPPSVATIKALAVPESMAIRGQDRNKAWEKTTLKALASTIAKRAKLKLFYDTAENPKYDRIEQSGESDLVFLNRLCANEGLCLKIESQKIIVLDEEKYERRPIIRRLQRKRDIDEILDWSFDSQTHETYRSCVVTHFDSKSKKTIKGTYIPPKPPPTSKILFVNEEAKSVAEAKKIAKKKLREKNKEAVTGSITVIGNPMYYAGATIDLQRFGWFDGKYIITEVTHSKNGGYTTTLNLRKCLEGY